MICERCNTENLDGSQYCDECGGALGTAPQTQADAVGDMFSASSSDGGNSPRPAPTFLSGGQEGASGAFAHEASGGVLAGPGREARSAVASAPAVSTAAPHAKLVIHRGRSVGKEFPMCEDETHIGRWDADGGIFPDVDLDSDDPEAKVSRRHARITRRAGQYYVEDLGSTNGTFINRGRRLLPGDRHPLRDGDEVIVGKTFLRFQVVE
jgi:hypothetical protein